MKLLTKLIYNFLIIFDFYLIKILKLIISTKLILNELF
jgi:hypothetical protein